jgi:hypothetical protein
MATLHGSSNTSNNTNRRYPTAIMLVLIIPTYLYIYCFLLDNSSSLSYQSVIAWEQQSQREREELAAAKTAMAQDETASLIYDDDEKGGGGTFLWRIVVLYLMVRIWLLRNPATTSLPTTTTILPANARIGLPS